MSYAATDAVEGDMRKELKVLEQLNDDIDQLSATARDCDSLAPEVKTLLDMAWYFAEKAMRETGRGSCGHVEIIVKPYCACCAHFREMRPKSEGLRSRL